MEEKNNSANQINDNFTDLDIDNIEIDNIEIDNIEIKLNPLQSILTIELPIKIEYSQDLSSDENENN